LPLVEEEVAVARSHRLGLAAHELIHDPLVNPLRRQVEGEGMAKDVKAF
jgi:hypothetical protein